MNRYLGCHAESYCLRGEMKTEVGKTWWCQTGKEIPVRVSSLPNWGMCAQIEMERRPVGKWGAWWMPKKAKWGAQRVADSGKCPTETRVSESE